MKLKIRLSTESINEAIGRLLEMQDELEYGMRTVVEILTTDGAAVAQSHYGSMAAVSTDVNFSHGTIIAEGKAVGIAEFGAGDATLPVLFENYPGFDVYAGSYSEQEGSQEYFLTGRWHFGDRVYTEVEPRAGLYNAKMHIMDNAVSVAQEVIQFD